MFYKEADIVIIGGGTVGCAIARELSRFKLHTILLEKNEDLCAEAGKANSGIVHSGFDAPVNSLESRLVTTANQMYDDLSKELCFPFQRLGALLVAVSNEKWKLLPQIQQNAFLNGVKNIQVLNKEQAKLMEPELTNNALGALFIPDEGITSPYEMAMAMALNAVSNGVEVLRSTKVNDIQVKNNSVRAIKTNKGTIKTTWIINSAGIYSDEISQMVNVGNFKITPRRGEFYVMDKETPYKLNHIILPVPSAISKGVLLTPTISGNLLIGPNAEDIESKSDTRVTTKNLNWIMAEAKKLIPVVSTAHTINQYAGLRPVRHPEGYSFDISPKLKGYIGISGIRSTGVTSAPAVAEYVRDLAIENGLNLVPRSNYNPSNKEVKSFSQMTIQEKERAIIIDSRYGNIVCRCEIVTEADIIKAIHGPLGARTLDGIKRRTRAGMGRCQGGFCNPRLVKILARELGMPIETITKKGPGSEILVCPTRSVKR